MADTSTLHSECRRALANWPWIPEVEAQHGLPRNLLLAVGSRETNLTNEVGDGGHGHGVWQLDDRSHTIAPGFDADVHQQAEAAARMLQELHQRFGDWRKALNAYNSGRPTDESTTGGNYGPDVLQRLELINGSHLPIPEGHGDAGATVVAYQRANVREQPNTQARIVSYVVAGGSYPATGWVRGETVRDNGIINDIWIRLSLHQGGQGYVSAVYLKGDEYAGLPH